MIKAIETRYKGYRFRSRLEARWAVFFDVARIEWMYEHEGFDLGGELYLPDFWFPEQKLFVEIKPGGPTDDFDSFIGALLKLRKLSDQSGHDVMMLRGDCWPRKYRIWAAHSDRWQIDQFEHVNPKSPDDYGESELRPCRRCNGLCYVHFCHEAMGDSWAEWGFLGNHPCNYCDKFPVNFEGQPYEAARSARF